MIVQACLNGSRGKEYHSAVPIHLDEVVADAIACVRAGAAELHFHVHADAGNESLKAEDVSRTVKALRSALPGTLFGISSGAWIESSHDQTVASIASWEAIPDYASVNCSETGAYDVMQALLNARVGIEAGVGSLEEAEHLIQSGLFPRVIRVLVEMQGQDVQRASVEAEAIVGVLQRARSCRPILLHGEDGSVWPMIKKAVGGRYSTRVGLEDGKLLPDGTHAESNAELVGAAVGMMATATRSW